MAMKFDEWISVTYGEDIKTKDRKLYDRMRSAWFSGQYENKKVNMTKNNLNGYTTEQLLFELLGRLDKPKATMVKIDYVEPIHQFTVGIGADHTASINITSDDFNELQKRNA